MFNKAEFIKAIEEAKFRVNITPNSLSTENYIKLLDEAGCLLVDIAKLLNIVTKDIIEKDREKSKAVVDVALSYGGSEFIKFVNTTIVNNNIDDNREQIEYNARQLVQSVFHDVYTKLNLYKGNNHYLSYYMKEAWKDEIYDDIINIIYNAHTDKYRRIIAFNNRIDIRITRYAAHNVDSAFG